VLEQHGFQPAGDLGLLLVDPGATLVSFEFKRTVEKRAEKTPFVLVRC
jgi:hypothetical protein